MITMLKSMRMRKNGIPQDVLPVFEEIVQTYRRDECEGKFMEAMEERLTQEQRLRLCEQNGSCKGAASDQERRAFATEHADKSLAERLAIFAQAYGRQAVLNADDTITVTFACHHGYYKHAQKGTFRFQESLQIYFERCAGGRLYELQKVLGVKLRMQSVDVSPLRENITNPVIFTFALADS